MGPTSDARSGRYESSLETYSVKVAGRWTTVRLEPAMMIALKQVALAEGGDIGEICTRLARDRRRGSLASAVRLYVLKHYRDRAGEWMGPGPWVDAASALGGFRAALLATERDDYVLRQNLDLGGADDLDSGIGFLFAYWKALSKGSDHPDFNDFTLNALQPVGFDPYVHLVDVDAADPEEFRIIRQAPKTVICRIGDNVPLKRLGDTLYPREIKTDYNTAKLRRMPVLQRVAVRTSEGAIKYQRIILPCGSWDGRISRLVVGVAPLGRVSRAGRPAGADA